MEHLRSNHNMAQQLSVIGIIIHRKCRNFFRLSDIMKDCCGQKQVAVQCRVGFRIKIAEFGHI